MTSSARVRFSSWGAWPAWIAIADLLLEAQTSLHVHRLRSALSVTGVVCGVASILVSVAVVQGGRRDAIAAVASLGERNVIVRTRQPTPGALAAIAQVPPLRLVDLRALRTGITGITAAAAIRTSQLELAAAGRRVTTIAVGVTPEWRDVSRVTLAAGRWLTTADVRERRRVLVLGSSLASQLFAGVSPLEAYVKAAGEWYEIVGVLEARAARPAAQLQRFDIDQAAFAPFSAADWRRGAADSADAAEEIVAQFANARLVDEAPARVASLLHSISPGVTADGLEIVVPREIIRARLQARRSFDVMLVGVALVSLLISGVAVMNIMLVSVSERTHEIGVRRACGARRSDIRRQFTMEAALLTIVGAGGGLLLAAIVVLALAAAGWPTRVTASSSALALGVVIATGLGSGIYPACRAGRLLPAEAIRRD